MLTGETALRERLGSRLHVEMAEEFMHDLLRPTTGKLFFTSAMFAFEFLIALRLFVSTNGLVVPHVIAES